MSFITDLFHHVIDGVKHLFTKDNLDKAKKIADRLSSLVALAIPYAQSFAALTSTPVDDEIVAAAAKLSTTVEGIKAIPDRDTRKDAVEKLLTTAVKDKLHDLLAAHGDFSIGDIHIKDTSGIEKIGDSLIEAAIKNAYVMFVKDQEPVAAPAVAEQPTAPLPDAQP